MRVRSARPCSQRGHYAMMNARSFRAALQSKGALCYDGGVDSSLRRAFGRGDGSMGQSET